MTRRQDINNSAARKPPLCAGSPVLWSLLPLAAGIVCARYPFAGLISILVLLSACATLKPDSRRWIVILSSLATGFLMMHVRRTPAHAEWSCLPAREATLCIAVDALFNARKDNHHAGTGHIIRTTVPADTISGNRLAFYLKDVSGKILHIGLGETLQCRGVLTYLPGIEQKDDYQKYLLGHDIFLTLNQGAILQSIAGPPRMEKLRLGLTDRCRQSLSGNHVDPDHPGKVLASMLLGDRSLLSDERITLFKRSGTFHLFAVSGLHIGSFALCLHLLSALLRIPRAWRILPVLTGTWAYVWLTGSSPSAVRAGIMITCLSLARHLLRQPHLFPAMSLSAWLVLVFNPAQLFDLGFQLSYGVVASILLVGLPLARLFRDRIDRLFAGFYPRIPWHERAGKTLTRITDVACVSLSAGVASMPLMVQHFHLFAPGGMVLGVILNPLAGVTIILGCLAMLAGLVLGGSLAGWLAVPSYPVIQLMEWLLDACLRIPGAVSDRKWPCPATGTTLLLGMLVLAWGLQYLRQNGKPLPEGSLFLPLLLVAAVFARFSIGA